MHEGVHTNSALYGAVSGRRWFSVQLAASGFALNLKVNLKVGIYK